MSSASIESRSRPAEPIAESDSQQQREQCPRCESTNTKFCYYNNYNTSQPRHFCKSCRRYWTLGGSLRNIPIGGSSRKRFRTNVFPSHISKQSRTGTGGTNIVPSHVFGLNRFFPAQLVSFGGPFLQSRAGFELELGLGSQSGSGLCSNSLEENGLGFGLGNGPITWPLSLMNEEGGLFGNEPNVDMWKMDIGRMEDDVTVPAIGMW